MPENCIVCRIANETGTGNGNGNGKLVEEVRKRNERRLVEERTLQGLREYLPRIFGESLCVDTVEGVDARIEEVRRNCRRDIEVICWGFEGIEGRRMGW